MTITGMSTITRLAIAVMSLSFNAVIIAKQDLLVNQKKSPLRGSKSST
jgi:hypothetical protein